MHACENCPSDYSCTVLATALKVAESLPDLVDRPALNDLVKRIKGRLAEAGWNHLQSQTPCTFAGKDAALQQMTAQLIAEVHASRREIDTVKATKQHAVHVTGVHND
jgi:hypothetical protein